MVRRDICVIIVESEERKSEDYGADLSARITIAPKFSASLPLTPIFPNNLFMLISLLSFINLQIRYGRSFLYHSSGKMVNLIVEFSGVNSPLASIAAHFKLLPFAYVFLYLFP